MTAIPKPSRRARLKAERAAHQEGVLTRAALRSDVFQRDGHRCCYPGCGFHGLELDHFWGRGKEPETLENCWSLCPLHHGAKTLNQPSRFRWVALFRRHALAHGYAAEVAKCDRAMALEEAHRASRRSAP